MHDEDRFYYFQVGDPVDGQPADCIGMDGKLVRGEDNLTQVRKFSTMRAANQFYVLLDGRYGVQGLKLRWSTWPR
jgi:hypothetical protein